MKNTQVVLLLQERHKAIDVIILVRNLESNRIVAIFHISTFSIHLYKHSYHAIQIPTFSNGFHDNNLRWMNQILREYPFPLGVVSDRTDSFLLDLRIEGGIR